MNLNYATVGNSIFKIASDLLKYMSYLLGHALGLGKGLDEIAPEVTALITENSWFAPSLDRLEQILMGMLGSFVNWKSMAVFDPLKNVVRNCIEDCGIKMSDNKGQLFIFVRSGRIPV